MLTTDQMNTILNELMLGKPPSIHTAEADEFRVKLKRDVDKIKADGLQVDTIKEIAG